MDKWLIMEENIKTIKEPIVPYMQDFSLNDLFNDKLSLINLIRNGVSYKLFEKISKFTQFNELEWASILNISPKSMQRYKQSKKSFKPIQSEKIIEMAEVTQLGLEVFGNKDNFHLWLDTPNFALGNYKPKELIKDSYGKELVITELNQINYGIFA